MNVEEIINEVLSIAGTFDFKLIIFLFLICAVGEFGLFSIPYLLETIWLMSGYNLNSGLLEPYQMLILWFTAQAGRQTGATVLYYFSQIGNMPLKKFYQKHFKMSISDKLANTNSIFTTILIRIGNVTVFAATIGRLLGLRIPLTLTLGACKRYKVFFFSILLSSLIWDGIYITLGIVGSHMSLKPFQVLLVFLLGMTAIYLATLIIKRLCKRSPKANTE